jgi:predicted phage terminase large subunit-like protein
MNAERITPENIDEALQLAMDMVTTEARFNFWAYCKTLAPDFYKEGREYLKVYCDTLQKIYEGKLLNEDGEPYRNIIVEMPPRHGKSRTLTLFSSWCLGVNQGNRVITASFNDDLAQSFSMNTRDIIQEKKNEAFDIVYSDIFDAKIKRGNASYKEWALEGQHFSYKGSGVGGSITGKGANILIMDDLVKDAETAYNEMALDKIWRWYTGTFISRAESGAIRILSMTPWSAGDPGARLQQAEGNDWYLLSFPACTDGKMLCDSVLSFKDYKKLKAIGDQKIITANYDLERIDVVGSLYGELKTYDVLPDDTEGKIGYTDTADEGSDFLCSVIGLKKSGMVFVTDVVYTQDAQEKTEYQLADAIAGNDTRHMMIESNNGGRAFARNVERILRERDNQCVVEWFYQGGNKNSRILTNAPAVKQKIIMPKEWAHMWPEFYIAVTGFQREGKNKHDDAPDVLTGLVEKFILMETAFDEGTRNALKARRARR